MKLEAWIFNGIAVFCIATSVVYGVWAKEPVGVVGLALTGGLCLIVGGYFWFVSRRIDPRPEDRKDADISEGAGELGFFSPGSYWPFGIAASAALTAIGIAFFYPWLILVGFIAIMLTVGGLLFEYYVGQNASH